MSEPNTLFSDNLADGYMMISTKNSKYAHSLNWSPWGTTHRPACGLSMPSFDSRSEDYMRQTFVKGKPHCPRCLSRLRYHIEWLRAYTDSYERLHEGTGRTDDE